MPLPGPASDVMLWITLFSTWLPGSSANHASTRIVLTVSRSTSRQSAGHGNAFLQTAILSNFDEGVSRSVVTTVLFPSHRHPGFASLRRDLQQESAYQRLKAVLSPVQAVIIKRVPGSRQGSRSKPPSMAGNPPVLLTDTGGVTPRCRVYDRRCFFLISCTLRALGRRPLHSLRIRTRRDAP